MCWHGMSCIDGGQGSINERVQTVVLRCLVISHYHQCLKHHSNHLSLWIYGVLRDAQRKLKFGLASVLRKLRQYVGLIALRKIKPRQKNSKPGSKWK
ncbi:hypothetical protein RRG08_027097 [Elysia crispata]|uniref:Uncharacterized protein n=1 Tax=Elysia crispata TaxID=231223 RepID=A0AAE0YTD7_9GAST|nr:hypothetical protein RRG08_027097 [Elysia crispata]